MKAAFLAASAAMLMAGSAQASTTIGGFTFTSSATSVISVGPTGASDWATINPPPGLNAAGNLAAVLTDNNPATGASYSPAPGTVTLGFANGILNGNGNDFVLFDFSRLRSFTVTINNVSVTRLTSATGSTVTFFPGGLAQSLNAAAFNLSEFGLAAGSSISSAQIRLDTDLPFFPTSLLYAGVLNTGTASVVPEPSTWMLMIMGFGLIAQQLRRRHRGVAQVAA